MSKNKTDFQAKLKELEAITSWFESDDVDLDEAVSKFEEGLSIVNELKKHIRDAQNRITEVKKKFDTLPESGAGEG